MRKAGENGIQPLWRRGRVIPNVPCLHALCVKLGFFAARLPKPLKPLGTSKDANMRYLDIHEGDALDEAQLTKWSQAAKIPLMAK